MRSGWRATGLAVVSVCLLASACGKTDPPALSEASASPPPQAPTSPRVETMVVDYSASHQALTLSGKVAYGEDRYSKISSPLQGRVVEVRVHLGDRVKAGDVLLVVDSPDIAQAYSEYVKEDSDLHYATRAFELAKDLY